MFNPDLRHINVSDTIGSIAIHWIQSIYSHQIRFDVNLIEAILSRFRILSVDSEQHKMNSYNFDICMYM